MRSEYFYILIIIGFIAVFAIGIFTAPITLHEPVAISIGLPLITGIIAMYFFMDRLRWTSDQIVTRRGHFSVRIGVDIYPMPWMEFLDGDKQKFKDGIEPIKYGNMVAVTSGSIHRGALNLDGRPEDPIIECPAKYLERIGNQIACRAHLTNMDYFSHNLAAMCNLQHLIKGDPAQPNNKRIKLKKKKKVITCVTPFLHGITSPVDSSDTAETLKFEYLMREENKLANFYRNRTERIMEQTEKEAASKEAKSKPVALLRQQEET